MNASWVRRLTSWSSRIRSISSVLESSSNTCYLTLNRLRASSFLRRSRSTSGGLLLGAATYSYTESTESPPELPKNPVDLPNSHLSHEVNDNNILKCLFLQYWTSRPLFRQFLIRQSCAISVESSSQFLTHVVMGIEEVLNEYIGNMSELANLYEDSVLAVTDEGADRWEQKTKQVDVPRHFNCHVVLLSEFCTWRPVAADCATRRTTRSSCFTLWRNC